MQKNYVLDTNVLIYDPKSIFQFEDNHVWIPIHVLEEVDKFKTEPSQRGSAARTVTRSLDELRASGDLSHGVDLEGGGKLTIAVPAKLFTLSVAVHDSFDHAILQTALDIKSNDTSKSTILVTMDINLRVRAEALGMQVATYENNRIDIDDLDNKIIELDLEKHMIDEFYSRGKLSFEDLGKTFNHNQCILLKSYASSALGRVKDGHIVKVDTGRGYSAIKPKNVEQQFALDLLFDSSVKLVTIMGAAGTGKTLLSLLAGLKAVTEGEFDKLLVSRPVIPMGKDIGYLPGPQPLDAKIVTPKGWAKMGDLNVGDSVIGRDGIATKVIGIYPKGKKEVYNVTTTDGTSTECCLDHLWLTKTFEEAKRQNEGSVRTTKQIIETLRDSKGRINHYLPRNEPVQYEKQNLPLPPYSLGVLLGDGSIGNHVSISNVDSYLIDRCAKELESLNCHLTNNDKTIIYNIRSVLKNNKPAKIVKITFKGKSEEFQTIGDALSYFKDNSISINRSTLNSRCKNKSEIDGVKYEFLDCPIRWANPVKNKLEELGLSKSYAWTKFIPDVYKYSSVEDRTALLRGLMDTDGTIKKSGECSFTTTSKKLAEDLIEIVRSLGGRASLLMRNRVGKTSVIKGRTLTTRRPSYEFTVSLPAEINPFYIPRKAERFKCSYIFRVGIESIELVGEKEVQCIKVENEEHLYLTDNFIVTHNTAEEKMNPWMKPIWDNLDYITMTSVKKGQKLTDQVEVEPLTYIRGRSIPNQFMLIDECQNLTPHEVKTIITRCGTGTKIVLTGDPHQIDSPYLDASSNGLTSAVKKLTNNKMVGHIRLTKGERSELATLAAESM